MADSAEVGALRISLSMATAQFEEGAKRAKSALGGFADSMGLTAKNAAIAGAAIGTAIGAGLAAVAYNVRNAINEIDDMAKSAMKLGVPIEQLSKLKYVADMTDVSFESLGTGVKKLSVNMVALASGDAAGAVEDAFKGIGVSVVDANGKLKSSEQVLMELADKFVAMADGPAKTALAIQIFGKAGADMIPLLNEGSAAIGNLTKRAEDLGLVITDKTAKAADEFNDNLTELQTRFDALWRQVAKEVLPHLIELSQNFLKLVGDGKDLSESVSALKSFLVGFTAATIRAVTALQLLWTTIEGTTVAAWKLATEGFAAASARLDEMSATAAGILRRDAGIMAALYAPPPTMIEKWEAVFTSVGNGMSKATDAVLRDADEKWKAWFTSMGNLGRRMAGELPKPEGKEDDGGGYGTQTAGANALRTAVEDLHLVEVNRNNDLWAGYELTAQMMTQQETLIAQLQQIQYLWDTNKISIETYGRASSDVLGQLNKLTDDVTAKQRKLAQNATQAYFDMASGIGSALTAIFGENKGVAIAMAVINTAGAVMKTLEQYGGMPWGWAAAAAVAATGAAQIATIAKTNKNSSGGGGAAAAGITPSAAGGGGGGGGAGGAGQPLTQTMYVKGIRGDEFYSGDMIRGLVTELLDYQRDGGRIILER